MSRIFTSLWLAAVILASIASSKAWSATAPEIVLTDTLALDLNFAAGTLDTVHFDEPSLLVGTYRDADGVAAVVRVAFDPLRVVDTIITMQYFANSIRAAHLDNDGVVDYLIAFQSRLRDPAMVSGLITVSGANRSDVDTMFSTTRTLSVAADDDTHGIWFSEFRDTSYYRDGGICARGSVYRWWGTIYHMDLFGGPSRAISNEAAIELVDLDINHDGKREPVAFWMAYSGFCLDDFSCAGAPQGKSMEAGMLAFRSDDSTIKAQWASAGTTTPCDVDVSLDLQRPTPIVDLNGDSVPEAVVLSSGAALDVASQSIAAYSLATGLPIWHPEHCVTSVYGFGAVFLQDIDHDSLPDVVFVNDSSRYQNTPELSAFKGTTGESLFVAPVDPSFCFRATHGNVLTVSTNGSGSGRAVLFYRDTIFQFTLSFPSGVNDDTHVRPDHFALYPNYPNPFNASTRIEYTLDRPTDVRLAVYDILGRKVETLMGGLQPSGRHALNWEANDRGSGVYFIVLEANGARQVRKALLLK